MTSNEILKADVLDILFDNRNKQYGAYTLRKNYNSRLTISLLLALGFSLLIFLLLNKTGLTKVIYNPPEDFVLRTVDIPKTDIKKPEPPKPQKQIVQPPVKQRIFTNRIDITTKDIPIPPTHIADLTDAAISDINSTGISGNNLPPTNIVAGNGTAKEEKPVTKEAPIQREPEFPGGMQAWLDFLRKNLTPPEELDAGEKKTVVIRFEVAADGTVTNFQVAQSGGRLFDNEVIRVLKKMPKWKPAIQNGLPIARSFAQPVTFTSTEE